MAGDMVWRPDQRVVPARFLGHTVQLPEAPFMLALVSGAPLYVFFASMRGSRQYHFSVSGPMVVTADGRAQRRPAVVRAAQAYAERLEATGPAQSPGVVPFLSRFSGRPGPTR